MTYADDIFTMLDTLGAWADPAKPSPIYVTHDKTNRIKEFIGKHISAIEIRHGDNAHTRLENTYENQVIEVPVVLSATDHDNLEAVMDKLHGIVNKYSNTPSALNGTTYDFSYIIDDLNTSSLGKHGVFVMNFSIFIGHTGIAKTIEA